MRPRAGGFGERGEGAIGGRRTEQIVDRLNHPELHLRLDGDEIEITGKKVVGGCRRLDSAGPRWGARPHGHSTGAVGGQAVDPVASPGQTEVHARRIHFRARPPPTAPRRPPHLARSLRFP